MLIFTVLASLLTGALCGLLPALQLSRSNPGDALKDGDRGGSSGHGARTRNTLVVAEVALSLMLLASAGLLIRTLGVLQRVSPGFAPARAITMQLLLPQTRYPNAASMIAFYRRLHDELSGDAGGHGRRGLDDPADDRQRYRHGLRARRPRGRSERPHLGLLLRRQPRLLLDARHQDRARPRLHASATTSGRRRWW